MAVFITFTRSKLMIILYFLHGRFLRPATTVQKVRIQNFKNSPKNLFFQYEFLKFSITCLPSNPSKTLFDVFYDFLEIHISCRYLYYTNGNIYIRSKYLVSLMSVSGNETII